MNKKKLFAFLLAMQMLLLNAVSCGNGGGIGEETKKTDADAGQTGTTETSSGDAGETEEPAPEEPYAARLNVSDGLPDVTYDGKGFRFLVDQQYAYQLFSEDSSGVGLDAEIYDRNLRVEDRFDIKISCMDTLGRESQDVMTQYAQVGEHVAEVVAYEQYMGNTPAIYFCWANWTDIPYLNFDQPWWNKESIESHIINDYCFNIAGDLSLSSMQMTWCLAVNMDLMQDWGCKSEELYDLVWSGEWTLDKLMEIVAPLWVDENGDGQGDNGDKFGYGSPISTKLETGEIACQVRSIPWITALGERAITVGEDRMSLTNTLGTEKMYAALEKLIALHHNTKGANQFARDDTFLNGNIGIYTAQFDIFFSGASEIDFATGVLPLPKYDAAQQEYLTAPHVNFTMFGVPITLPEEDYGFCGIIMEALNAESWKTVYPAYYEEALKGRYSSDTNMAEMIDLITNSRVYEYGILCAQSLGTVKLPYLVCTYISANNTDLASLLAEHDHAIKRTLAEILTFFDVEDESGILGADYEIPDNQFGG